LLAVSLKKTGDLNLFFLYQIPILFVKSINQSIMNQSKNLVSPNYKNNFGNNCLLFSFFRNTKFEGPVLFTGGGIGIEDSIITVFTLFSIGVFLYHRPN